MKCNCIFTVWDFLNHVNVPNISVILIDLICLNLLEPKQKLKNRSLNYFGM